MRGGRAWAAGIKEEVPEKWGGHPHSTLRPHLASSPVALPTLCLFPSLLCPYPCPGLPSTVPLPRPRKALPSLHLFPQVPLPPSLPLAPLQGREQTGAKGRQRGRRGASSRGAGDLWGKRPSGCGRVGVGPRGRERVECRRGLGAEWEAGPQSRQQYPSPTSRKLLTLAPSLPKGKSHMLPTGEGWPYAHQSPQPGGPTGRLCSPTILLSSLSR